MSSARASGLLGVVLVACVRSVTATDAGLDAGFDTGLDAGFDAGFDAGVTDHSPTDLGTMDAPLDATIGEEPWSDAGFVGEAPSDRAPIDTAVDVPDAGSCRGYVPRSYCMAPCDRCAFESTTAGCAAESRDLQDDPECMMYAYDFELCFMSCVLNLDAGYGRCLTTASGGLIGSCACYERCVPALPPRCQPRRRAFDRCVESRCPACR